MTEWAVTLRTGETTWSTVTVQAVDHTAAVTEAQRLLGDHPVTRVT